ncbi:MAG: hypothetical protein V2A69_14365 [Pseudomonadota bacterium]
MMQNSGNIHSPENNNGKEISAMRKFDQHSMQEVKSKLDVELLGVASVEKSTLKELKERATSLLPNAKSVVVLGKFN